MRYSIIATFGAIGGLITTALGGWDYALRMLLIIMAIDYISGWVVAAVFKKSRKTSSGAVNSTVGFKGIAKKVMLLFLVAAAHQIDLGIGTAFVRTAVIFAFAANELVSLMENAGLMGIPWPPMLKRALDLLREKGEHTDDNNTTTKP